MHRDGVVFAGVLFATTMLAAGDALAVDDHTMSASACYVYLDNGSMGTAGRLKNLNSDSTDVEVSCPLVRDNTSNTTGLSSGKAYVHRNGAANAEVITCTLYSVRNASGASTVIDSSTKSILSTDTGALTLDFGTDIGSSDNTTGNAASFYNLYCDLARYDDWLYGYSWTEP